MDISELKGKTLISIVNNNNEELVFTTKENEVYKLYHEQDCCETVTLEDIVGDLNDLLYNEIIVAEEVSNAAFIENNIKELRDYGTYTWTFYKLATINGYVDLRWYGESNGYYSESVNFTKVE